MEGSRASVRLRAVVSAVAVLIAVTAIACGNGETLRPIPTSGPAQPTPAPRSVSIPADERSHDDRLEWWYYHGHLTADSGEEFGFHSVIFQSRSEIQTLRRCRRCTPVGRSPFDRSQAAQAQAFRRIFPPGDSRSSDR